MLSHQQKLLIAFFQNVNELFYPPKPWRRRIGNPFPWLQFEVDQRTSVLQASLSDTESHLATKLVGCRR